jgi:hypothetical protein
MPCFNDMTGIRFLLSREIGLRKATNIRLLRKSSFEPREWGRLPMDANFVDGLRGLLDR